MFYLNFLSILFIIELTQATPPKIDLHPNSLIVNQSDPVTLECRASGDPKPKITWFKDNNQINIDSHKSKYTLIHDSNLFIFSATLGKQNKTDSGVYQCRAENEHGVTYSSNATLVITFLKDDFRDLPKNRQVNSGTSVIMECKAPKGHPEPNVYWLKNNEVLKPDPNLLFYPNGSLLILNATLNDNGEYVCVARNDAGSKRTPQAFLNVFEKPRIISRPESVRANSKDKLELKCEATGFPRPQIEWKKDGSYENIPQKSIINDNLLIIPNVDYDDEGEYACVATNQLASVEDKFFINVYERPMFTKQMSNMTVGIEGKSLIIECNARGRPQPVIYWAKSASQNQPTQDDFIILENGNLYIEKLTKKYEGIYLCQASNDHGSIETKTMLKVKQLELNKTPPQIIYHPQNQTIPINTQANLECVANGEAKIKWFKDSKEINLVNSLKYRFLDNGELVINLVQKADSGFYRCTATNLYGETKSFNGFLNIENPNNQYVEFQRNHETSALPSAPTQPIVFKITSRSVSLSWQGSSHTGHSPLRNFIIEYYSPEWATSEWLVLTDDVTTQSYTINNLQPDTYYTFSVRAKNSQGYGPPSEMSDLIRTQFEPVFSYSNKNDLEKALTGEIIQLNEHVDQLTSTSCNISWKLFKSNYLIQGYYIKYKPIGQKDYLIDNLPTNKYSFYVLNNLKKFTTYEILVEPYSGTVKGSESNVIQVKTLEDVPSHSPVSISLEVMGVESLSIKWQPPPTGYLNGVVLGYRISCHGNDTKNSVNLNTNSTTRAIILGNLIPSMTYCVKIAAFNKIGTGPYTAQKCIELIPDRVSHDSRISNVIQETWFIGLLTLVCASVIFLFVTYFIWLFYKRRLLVKKSNSKKYLSNNSTLLSDSRIDKNGNRYKLVGNDTQVWLDTMGSDEVKCSSPGPQYAEVYAPTNPYATSGLFCKPEQNLYNLLSYQQNIQPVLNTSSYTIKLINDPDKNLIKYLQSTQSQTNTPKIPVKLQQRVKSVEGHVTLNVTQQQLMTLLNQQNYQQGYQPTLPVVPPPSLPQYVQTWSDPSNSSSLVSNLTNNSTLSRNGSTFTSQQYVRNKMNNQIQQDYSSISPEDEIADEFKYVRKSVCDDDYLNLEPGYLQEQQMNVQKKFVFLNQTMGNSKPNEIYISDEMPQTVL